MAVTSLAVRSTRCSPQKIETNITLCLLLASQLLEGETFIPRPTSLSSVQPFSRVLLFATPWAAARQTYLSITNSRELAQTHVHQVSDAIQPSRPLSSPSPAFNLSQHQGRRQKQEVGRRSREQLLLERGLPFMQSAGLGGKGGGSDLVGRLRPALSTL